VHAFLVFGNDRRVPVEWLKRYGNLVADVAFYFIDDAEHLEDLAISNETGTGTHKVAHMIADSKLERDFHQQMLGIYRSAASELGYRATRFLEIVNNRSGVQAAKELLHRSSHPEGLTKLWEYQRLDLSMEALVLRSPWSHLFTKEELSFAFRRLRELGYNGPEMRFFETL
jgi:hypothetical protein